ncbi:MAG: DUF2156 domain-containing protein [Candidatus Avilachnospira sp.]|jgi:hypothetical protein
MAESDLLKPEDLQFKRFDGEALVKYKEFFYMRPNKSCDSGPVDSFIWRDYYDVKYCVVNDEALLMTESGGGKTAGIIPLCAEENVGKYFKLLERYFNEVLKLPFIIYLADEEGVEAVRRAGLLENYTVTEEEDLKDYLYSGDDLRELKGRKFAKKRNHINGFLKSYEGRWSYRRLTKEDKLEILSCLSEWKLNKDAVGEESGVAMDEESFDAMESLDAEIVGIHDILNHDKVFDSVRAGGIFIDGKLKAFSIGNYNPREKMAIIDIEKADPEIVGLYQIINREFLVHEFPEAEIINREDDVGLPGLRKAKLSYFPIGYERKYMVIQNHREE